MTVASTTLRSPIVQANGVTRNWAFDFFWYEVSTLYFYVRADGVDTLIAPENYTLTPGPGNERDGFAGGTITYPIAPAPVLTTGEIYITRLLPLNQETVDLGNSSGFSPRVVERAFDEIVMQMQQIAAGQVETGVVLTPNRDDVFVLPSPASNRIIGWNGTATALENKLTGAAIGVDEEGRVTQVSGTALITPAGGDIARTLADHLGDELSSGDIAIADGPAAAYLNNTGLRLFSGESTFLECDPTGGDDFEDMAIWAANNYHIVPVQFADGVHDVEGYVPLADIARLSVRGSATPTVIAISSVTYTSLGSDLYRATITVAAALPARVVVGYGVIVTPVVANTASHTALVHPCAGGHAVQTIAGDRLSFTVHFRGEGPTSSEAGNTAAMTAGTLFGMPNNTVLVPFCSINLTGGWVGASEEGFFRVERGARLNTKWLSMVYTGSGDSDREMIFVSDGGQWTNTDYSAFMGTPSRVFRAGQGGKAYVNRAYIGNPDGEECVQILSAGVTFVRSVLTGGTTACVTFGAASSDQSTSSIAMGSPIGLRTTGAGALIRWDSSGVFWCDTGARPTAGEISFNSSACRIEFCTDALGFGSSAFPKYITGDPTIANCTNTTITRGILTSGGRWIDSSTAWTSSIIYTASTSIDFGALGTARAYVEAPAPITVTGAVTTDRVEVFRVGSVEPAGVIVSGRITAADTLRLYALDLTAANINPTAITLRIVVTRDA